MIMRSLFAALLVSIGWGTAAHAASRCAIGMPGQTGRVTIGDTGRSMLIHRPHGQRCSQAAADPLSAARQYLDGCGDAGEFEAGGDG